MIIVGYNPGVGQTPIQGNIFDGTVSGTTSGLASVNGLQSIYQPVNKKDYKVYRDKVFRLGGQSTGTIAQSKMFNQFIKLRGRKITYDGNNVGTFNQNWTYCVCWIAAQANNDSTGTDVEMSCLNRFYYKDS